MKDMAAVDRLTKLTRRREYEDGLADLVFACAFLVFGLLVWFFLSAWGLRLYLTALIRHRDITIVGMLGLVAAFVLLVPGSRRLVDWVRRSSIWKESGFVKPLRWQVKWPVNLAACLVLVAIVVLWVWRITRGLASPESLLTVIASASGISAGVVFLGMGMDLGLRRYILVGVAGMVYSGLILVLPVSFSGSWLALGVGWMVLLGLSGTWAFRRALLDWREQRDG